MKSIINKKHTYITSILFALSFSLTGCIEETSPTDTLTSEQVSSMASSQEGLLNGIVSYMITYNSWGASSSSYYLNDWGYPCQMFYREVCGSDIPVYSSSYSYWYSLEAGTSTYGYSYYTYRYYYNLIKCCNDLISVIDPATATETSKQYLGVALAFRAMCYMDMARMFEYKKTGVASIDDQAEANGIWGLTVPIVTPDLDLQQLQNNPRVDFATMYRFILTDLNEAEKYIGSFVSENKTMPNKNVVYGLKARLWLEMASRFDQSASDLSAMISKDSEAIKNYDKVGITSATQCYQYAREYARKAYSGYTPVTEAQWHDRNTGFNTPNQAWMWCMSYTTKEQLPTYYCTFTGTMASEPEWGMARGYKAYRMIGSSLYSSIANGDWRKYSWIDPKLAGTDDGYEKYESIDIDGVKTSFSLLSKDEWKELPAYANTKFRPAKDGMNDYQIGCLVDIPLMRMEEMKFIDIECTAHLEGVEKGLADLKSFINTYRYTDGSYDPQANTIDDFNHRLTLQKRIEFWGEGINFFDYKRLNMQVRRKDNSNYESAFLINSKENCVAPWMNYYILLYEINANKAVKPNPDTSGAITAEE